MKIIKKILKGISTAFCIIAVLTYTLILLFPPEGETLKEVRVVLIFLDAMFAFFLYLLLRKKKGNRIPPDTVPEPISPYLPEVPAETLKDMRKCYSAMQAVDDTRIMQESLQLIQCTTDFDTFFSRLELLQRKAFTLLQAAQAKCRGVNRENTVKACEKVLSSIKNAKVLFLHNSCTKEISSALQLKTKSGQYKRLERYLANLYKYEYQFITVEDAFSGTVSMVKNLMGELQGENKDRPKEC